MNKPDIDRILTASQGDLVRKITQAITSGGDARAKDLIADYFETWVMLHGTGQLPLLTGEIHAQGDKK